MRGIRWWVSLFVVGAGLVVGGRSAWAQAPNCTITVTPVSFGLYNVFSTTALTSTGSVTYNCTNRTGAADTITIWMSKGMGSTNNPRQMFSGINSLSYYLCQDANCNKLWGDQAYPSDSGPINTRAGNTTVSLPIYGVIPAGQDVSAGTYTDTILMEVDF